MNRIVFALLATFLLNSFSTVRAQKIAPADLKLLHAIDDSLGDYGAKILDEVLPAKRLTADSMFTRLLVRALKVPNSFYFGFDSMQIAPVVYPDDSTFRIITWHYTLNDADYHQRGVMQMNTLDGSIKIFPLYDVSDYTDAPMDSIRTPQNWIGAVYYKIVQKSLQGNHVYTLLGYDENNDKTTRKWMEILSFNHNGEPRWGGSFTIADSTSPKPVIKPRFMMEYKKGSSAKLNYDPDEDLIVMDHLVSENNHPEDRSSLVPGGDYEAFKWVNGNWLNDPKLFTQILGDGNEPREQTILNADGTADESKLMEQSEKNMNKNTKPAVKPAVKPVKKGKS